MVAQLNRGVPAEHVIRLEDKESGLDGVIVVHSTALGPGAGGCRFWSYPDIAGAAADAARLARGMSYKNAMAGLPFGGAKAVLRRPSFPFDRTALFRAFGRAVADLDGLYITAEDVGTSVADMRQVATETRYVAGLDTVPGRAGGDPSPWTAQGVFNSMAAAARATLGADVGELRIAVQGVGNVGAALCRRLADEGARLIITDVDRDACTRLAGALGATVVAPDEIMEVDADAFAPCALGGVLSSRNVDRLKARLVCGGANNQLDDVSVADELHDRGIIYVPDYVANGGGIISVSAEYFGEEEAVVVNRIEQIGARVATILQESVTDSVSPAVIADRMAEEMLSTRARVVA